MKRTAKAWLLLIGACTACGADAVGVSECRQIEEARCEAAAKCGSVEDVGACKLFYHDHCLHGLALDDAPRAKAVTECVATIKAAGTCAAKHSAKTAPSECESTRLKELKATDARRVCDLVDEPERAPVCSFLVPEPEEEDEDEDDKDAGSADSKAKQTSADGG